MHPHFLGHWLSASHQSTTCVQCLIVSSSVGFLYCKSTVLYRSGPHLQYHSWFNKYLLWPDCMMSMYLSFWCSWGLVFLLCLTVILNSTCGALSQCVGAGRGRSSLLHCPGLAWKVTTCSWALCEAGKHTIVIMETNQIEMEARNQLRIEMKWNPSDIWCWEDEADNGIDISVSVSQSSQWENWKNWATAKTK